METGVEGNRHEPPTKYARKPIRLVGTCPSSNASIGGNEYLSKVEEAARWAEDDGWDALLVYTSNKLIDPWLISQHIIQHTKRLRPLIAVQPLYYHPAAVARFVAGIAQLYERQVALNMVAGDYPSDREALCDELEHDQRYERIDEYMSIVRMLLTRRSPTSFSGRHYALKHFQSLFLQSQDLVPAITIAGSSAKGFEVARKLGACAIQYPKPSFCYDASFVDPSADFGIRVGIIARRTSSDAWQYARRRFPEDKDRAALRAHLTSASDSVWVKGLSQPIILDEGHPYWLAPYKNYYSSCPFLVGSFECVAQEIARYIEIGFTTFLLEKPENRHDSATVTEVFKMAQRLVKSG